MVVEGWMRPKTVVESRFNGDPGKATVPAQPRVEAFWAPVMSQGTIQACFLLGTDFVHPIANICVNRILNLDL